MEEITMNVRSIFRSLSLSPNLVSYPDAGGRSALRLDRTHVDALEKEETSRAEHIHLQEHHQSSWTEKPLRPTDVPYERPGVIELMLMSGSR